MKNKAYRGVGGGMKIDKTDSDFAVNLTRTDIQVYDVCKPPFSVHGVIMPSDTNDRFCRMPRDVASTVSEGVEALYANTAGGRVRFKTDSDYIAIIADIPSDRIGRMSHFPLTGSAGFAQTHILKADYHEK